MSETDEFGYHEVLHTASIFVDMWVDHICSHGAVKESKALKPAAIKIAKAMGDFYQIAGGAIEQKFH